MQVLVYPRTAADEEYPSHHQFAEGHLLTRKTILWFHQHYRASDADRQDFRYAPLLCEDLTRLPPALIIVGECDPLHDDGIAYAERLQKAGNGVELTDYPGMVHPFFSMGGAVDAGRRAVTQVAGALKRAFANSGDFAGRAQGPLEAGLDCCQPPAAAPSGWRDKL
jgi:acetyl esterase